MKNISKNTLKKIKNYFSIKSIINIIFGKKKEKYYNFIVEGRGLPIVLLHGLMGNLSNFESLKTFLVYNDYKVFILSLPLYSLPILSTSVIGIAKYVNNFLNEVVKKPAILVGNSLGGHIALLIALKYPTLTTGLVLTGSSGLYERSFGETFPKRGDYSYIKRKTEEVFYNPKNATKELVDEIYDLVNNRVKAIKTVTIARSAIRNNLLNDLNRINVPVLLIWGKQDNITPPHVAKDFNRYIPNNELYWIDKCGHAPMMEQPEKFNILVLSWLKKIYEN